MGRTNKSGVIELGKDVLIVLLICSALWLTAKGPLSGLFQEDSGQPLTGQSQGGDRAGGAIPLAMVVNQPAGTDIPGSPVLPGGGDGVRCGLQYDQDGCQELFQQIAGVLLETLSTASTPERISRAEWERALSGQLSVYMDFQADVPVSVLVGWLSGEETQLDASIRRLVLAAGEDAVELYYRNEQDGSYYRCRSEMADPLSLENSLPALTANGAFYAFEDESFSGLDPDTLLFHEMPDLNIYTASNPVNGGQASLEEIVQDLGFSLSSTNFYPTDEQVARIGEDSIRLSDRGVLQYQAGDAGSSRLSVLRQGSAGTLFDAVETCRQIAFSVLGSRCGEARLYLAAVQETEGGWEVSFGYSLNGIPVQLDGGPAATFLVEKEQIVQFTMRVRSYVSSGAVSSVLPPKQAAAALYAMELEGEELVLCYGDNGTDALTAGWAARRDALGER